MRAVSAALSVLLLVSGQTSWAGMPVLSGASFERVKSLVGRWEGVTSNGLRVRETFELIAGGSAVLMLESRDGGRQTATVFYTAGAELRADHYCEISGHSQLVAAPAGDNGIRLSSVEGSASSPRRHGWVLWRFVTPDHHTQQWTIVENGRPAGRVAVNMKRIR